MRTVAPTPREQENRMGIEDIIVSKTDTKGVITYANDVFAQISGYTVEEIIGRPHSMIRHPDMPGGAFHLVWETLKSGEEIFAYVKNLCKDGSYYWVLAHITPSLDKNGKIIGYHSNRRYPDPSAIAAISPVYQKMRTMEKSYQRKAEAAQVSHDWLRDHLGSQGLTYEKFVWNLINGGK